MKVKEESEKAGLKITIQKTKIMAAAAAAKLLQLKAIVGYDWKNHSFDYSY